METSVTPHSDPGLDSGLGVFDTLLVQDHRPVELSAHLERLGQSALEVYGATLDRAALAARVVAAAHDGPARQRLRTIVTPRQPVRVEGMALAERPRGLWALVVSPLPGGFGAHKWVDRRRLDALSDDPASTSSDPLLVDEAGLVLETARGHLFVVARGVVRTPPLDGRILPGVVRRRVLATLADLGVPCLEVPLTLDDVAVADELFVTSSIGGVRGVGSVRGVGGWGVGDWDEGQLTRRVSSTIETLWASPDVVVIDHHDSYTWNLVHLVAEVTGRLPVVRQHDEVSFAEVLRHSHIILSPGPGHPGDPRDFGVGRDVLRLATVPVLGVCLGMQGMVTELGGTVDRVRPAHGEVATVTHDGEGLFHGLPTPFRAVRYHSLAAITVPDCLVVSARSEDGAVMGVRHLTRPLEGVQFHPESVLTEHGRAMMTNFLAGPDE